MWVEQRRSPCSPTLRVVIHLYLGWMVAISLFEYRSYAGEKPKEVEPGQQLDSTLGFAEWLYSQQDYYRAITEYQRYLFEKPEARNAPWVWFRVGESYLAGGRTEAARMRFETILEKNPTPLLRQWSSLAVARTFYLEGRLLLAMDMLQELLSGPVDADVGNLSHYLAGCIQLKLGQPKLAQDFILKLPANDPLSGPGNLLIEQGLRYSQIPHKSPVLAGLLSVVPGLGHVYLGEYTTALTAFLWNGLFGYAAYDAFARGGVGIGVLLTVAELFWYTGTIYGAANGAERYNTDAQQKFFERLDRLANMDIAFPDPARVQLMLLQGTF